MGQLKTAGWVNSAPASTSGALAKLRRMQHHRVTLNGAQTVTGISSINKEQSNILAALTIKKPTLDTQITLL